MLFYGAMLLLYATTDNLTTFATAQLDPLIAAMT